MQADDKRKKSPNPRRQSSIDAFGRESSLGVPERHQLRIARDTLRMSDVVARVMGGPTKEEAREIIRRLTGREPRENPASAQDQWPIRIDVRMKDPLDVEGKLRTYSYFGYATGDRKRVLSQKLRQARKQHPEAQSIEVLADEEALRS